MRVLIVTMLASLLLLLLPPVSAPASAQVRLFTDGQVIKIGPTKAERRARQTGAMRGAMSGPCPAQAGPGQTAPSQPSNRGIIRDVERAR